MTSRRQRPSQVRPRPPSTGRPAPKRAATRAPAPTRIAPHRKIERGPGLPIYIRILLVIAVLALGGVIVFAGMGLVGKVVAGIGSAFSHAITSVTSTPTPSPTEVIAPNAPTLSQPDEPYTNQPSIDLTGTVPAAYAGQNGVSVRVYRSVEGGPQDQVAEIPVGSTPGFQVAQVKLGKGRNDFTATIAGPGGESAASKVVTYILDTVKPKITITKPAKNAVVNGTSVTIKGSTQPRSTVVARNLASNATVTVTAGDDGSFTLSIGLVAGSNSLQVTATDPAGNQNQAALSVSRGSGKLTSKLTMSDYSFRLSQLPASVTLTVTVTDPDGHPVDGATVTFTVTPHGLAVIQRILTSDGEGIAKWTMRMPRGTAGGGVVAALVQTDTFGTVTVQTPFTFAK